MRATGAEEEFYRLLGLGMIMRVAASPLCDETERCARHISVTPGVKRRRKGMWHVGYGRQRVS